MVFSTSSLLFWSIAAAMTALALAFVLPRLVSRREPPTSASRRTTNISVFRDQLIELDRELALGNLTREHHAQARVELERRMLSEIGEDQASITAEATPAAGFALAIALPALAFAAYALFGDPGAAGAGTAVVSSVNDTVDRPVSRDALVAHLARTPHDGRSWVLLARIDFEANRYIDASIAYERALAVSAKVAADPAVWCEFADALGMANGGSLAGKPRELVMRALARDPSHPRALEMAGSAAFEAREYDSASGYWRALLMQLPEGTLAHRQLAAAISRAERLAIGARAPGNARRDGD